MFSYKELKEMGLLPLGELAAAMARVRHMNVLTMKSRIERPLAKIRGNLLERGLVFEASDREGFYFYSPELVLPLVAYIRWHRLGGRHSMARAMGFVSEALAGNANALSYLPPEYREFGAEDVEEEPCGKVIALKRIA